MHSQQELIAGLMKISGFEKLNPVQESALGVGALENNMVIAAPTASGKTFICEIAAADCVLNKKKKVVYIVPLKALASEKYNEFKKYEALGIKTAISVGDMDSSDAWLERYDVIICTSEKMDSLLRHGAPWIERIGLIVADEIHAIGEFGRGPTLEVLLTKLRRTSDAQIIALSATIKNCRDIADWLDAKLVKSDYRPVKLFEGVYAENKVKFVGKEGFETDDALSAEASIAKDTVNRKKQALVFVSTRRSAEAAAEKIGDEIKSSLSADEKQELSEISNQILNALDNPTKQCDRLATCVRNGAAFHHAGLVTKQRQLIEKHFKEGLIKIISATPTLCLDAKTELWDGTTTTPLDEMKNDTVLSLSGDKVTRVRVQEINPNHAPEKMIRITTFSGNRITVTPNHRMLVRVQGKEMLIQANECRKSHRIATIGNIPEDESRLPRWSDFIIDNKLPFADRKLDKRTFYVIGAMLGDGYSGAEIEGGKVIYKGSPSIVGRDKEIFGEIRKFCDFYKLHYRMSNNSYGVPQLVLSKVRWFREFLVRCGISVGDKKHIDARLLASKRSHLKWLLRGLLDTDGWVEQRHKRVGFSSISMNLIKDLRMSLLRYGIVTFVRKRKGGKIKLHKKIYYSKHGFVLYINQSIAVKRFFCEIGFLLKRKKCVLENTIKSFKNDLVAVKCNKCKYEIDSNAFEGRTRSQGVWGDQKKSIMMFLGKNGISTSREIERHLKFLPWKRERRLNNHFEFMTRERRGNTKVWELNRLGVFVYKKILLRNFSLKKFFISRRNCPFCKENLVKRFRKTWREDDISGDIFWDRIKSLTAVRPSTDVVYDVVLPNDGSNRHLFVANGFFVHNSMGMNLPAFRAVIRDAKRYNSLTGYEYISVLDYQQMTGRAGRPQFDEYGESILVAKNLDEAEELFERYVMGEPEDVTSKLASEPILRMHILSLVASGECSSLPSLSEFFARTFYGFQYGSSSELGEKLENMLGVLENYGFILVKNGRLRPTPIGKRVSELYIDPQTAYNLITGLRTLHENIGNEEFTGNADFLLLELISNALELRPLLSVKSADLRNIMQAIAKVEKQMLHKIPDEFDYEYDAFLRSFKTAMMFCDWEQEFTEEQMLEKYRLMPGELYSKLNILDWLLYSAQELALLLDAKEILKHIRKARVRMAYGIKEELLALVKLRDIGRARARSLFNAGFRTLEDLRNAPEQTLAFLIGSSVAKSIKNQLAGKVDEKQFRQKSLLAETE